VRRLLILGVGGSARWAWCAWVPPRRRLAATTTRPRRRVAAPASSGRATVRPSWSAAGSSWSP